MAELDSPHSARQQHNARTERRSPRDQPLGRYHLLAASSCATCTVPLPPRFMPASIVIVCHRACRPCSCTAATSVPFAATHACHSLPAHICRSLPASICHSLPSTSAACVAPATVSTAAAVPHNSRTHRRPPPYKRVHRGHMPTAASRRLFPAPASPAQLSPSHNSVFTAAHHPRGPSAPRPHTTHLHLCSFSWLTSSSQTSRSQHFLPFQLRTIVCLSPALPSPDMRSSARASNRACNATPRMWTGTCLCSTYSPALSEPTQLPTRHLGTLHDVAAARTVAAAVAAAICFLLVMVRPLPQNCRRC